MDDNYKGDLISRQAVDRLVWKYLRKGTDENIAFYEHFLDLPSVENKGEWISHYDEDAKEGWYECSCCHSERAFNTNFCPDCGADMREPKGEKVREQNEMSVSKER